MAFNLCKLSVFKRMMSANINAKLAESLSKSAIAKNLGNINEFLKSEPELNNYPVNLWEETHDFLKNEGFMPNKFTFMISQNPKLLTTSKEKIFETLNAWRAYQFGDRDTITLMSRYPELLSVQHSNELNKRIETLKEFVGGGNNIFKLILNSPGVVSESIDSINEKIEYLRNVMKVDPIDVYSSEVFSCDIQKLKTRHIFLKRLGLFIVKKKKDPKEISKNPRLYLITDTSDKRFASKVCHVTIDEYETFVELYRRELDNATEEQLSDGEDDDDDDMKFEARKI